MTVRDLPTEEWRPVKGYEGKYEVSNLGTVKRVCKGKGSKLGRVVRQNNHNSGYKTVSLWRDNRGKSYLVHRVIASAFLGEIANGLEVNHIDGDKTNNRADNLEIVTRNENIRHAMNIGLIDNRGANNPSAKLSEADVHLIKQLYRPKICGYKTLGKRFGVTPYAIRNIIKGYVWNHVN